MAAGQPQVVLAFAQALTELVTVEKKNIVVLTEIARDALRTEPAAAPNLAALISTRILQAGAGDLAVHGAVWGLKRSCSTCGSVQAAQRALCGCAGLPPRACQRVHV